MTVDDLKLAWNAQPDQYNQWDELGLDEIVHFAQQQEREACAGVCDARAEKCADKAAITDDQDDRTELKALAWQFSVLSNAIRDRGIAEQEE